MAQSAIGPGVKVFSRYARVVEADGSSMPVSAALAIINDVLGEVLDGEEAELDADTRFALTWFSEHGYSPGPAGDADSVARAKNTSLAGIKDSGIGEARAGKFRLYERHEFAPDWSPIEDTRRTVWEATQYLAAALERSETEAAELMNTLGGYSDRARQLAYLLYQKANDRGWAQEAGAYNGLITARPNLRTGAATVAAAATGSPPNKPCSDDPHPQRTAPTPPQEHGLGLPARRGSVVRVHARSRDSQRPSRAEAEESSPTALGWVGWSQGTSLSPAEGERRRWAIGTRERSEGGGLV